MEEKNKEKVQVQNGGNTVGESVIRKMTRLAHTFEAVNLSQGFPNEGPPSSVRVALARAVLLGRPANENDDNYAELTQTLESFEKNKLEQNPIDVLNQYSPPFGRTDVRQAIASYYKNLYDFDVIPDNITVTLGATEAVASALRTIGRPGDKVVILEPFHELYPNQCRLFYLEPVFVTLSEQDGAWILDFDVLEDALKESRIFLLNTPHNPTGKVFSHAELQQIVGLCLKYDVFIITDEIYEHMIYVNKEHYILPKEFPDAADQILVCNSIGKSMSATGWRMGWCIHPEHVRATYQGIHDQMVVMAPHPVQYASIEYLSLPNDFFREGVKNRYKERIDMLLNSLKSHGFQVSPPEGAYYIFAKFSTVEKIKEMSPMDAAMYLMEKVGVACVPGDNFYSKSKDGDHYLRFAACRSAQDIEMACKKLNLLSN